VRGVTHLHAHPDCTGRWRARRDGGEVMWWRCEECRARVQHTDQVANAALAENRLGMILRDLTRQGGRYLPRGGETAA
jgi:hypothetical protein